MKKALFVLGVLAFGAFFIPATARADVSNGSLFDSSPEPYYVVASSTVGSGQYYFWIGQADGTQSVSSITMSVNSTDPTATAYLRYTCFSSMATSSSPAPAQTGCTNTSAVNSGTESIYHDATALTHIVTFEFTPALLQSGKWYFVELQITSGAGYEVFGKTSYDVAYQDYYGGSRCTGCRGGTAMWILNWGFVPFVDPAGVATSSSLFSGQNATSTLTNLANQCSQSGNLFAEGLCTAGVFLFVPNPSVFEQYGTLNEVARTKIPFYYVSYIQGVFSPLATTTSSNLPLFRFPLSTASTSAWALPDLVISTTTVATYLPDWVREFLKSLITAGIWLAVAWHVYRTALNAPPV